MSLIKLEPYTRKGRRYHKALVSADNVEAQRVYFDMRSGGSPLLIDIDDMSYFVISATFKTDQGFEFIIKERIRG